MRRLVSSSVITGFLALAAPAVAQGDPGPLVDADWLAANLGAEGLAILDIRSGPDSAAAFAEAHIPGAVHSDYALAGWRTERDGVPGMLPSIAVLEALIGNLGISNDSHVVIVQSGESASDFGAAARVYWTFDYLGHDGVSILDGGFRAWSESPERPVASGSATADPTLFVAEPRPGLLIDTETVAATLDDPGVLRLDARPAEQHFGAEKAGPVAALGRIPDSLGLDQALFIGADGRLKPRAELEALVPEPVRDGTAETIVSYCNTGHWSATNWFVLSEILGQDNVTLYDASMAGWTADPSRPVETGKGGALDLLGQWLGDYRG